MIPRSRPTYDWTAASTSLRQSLRDGAAAREALRSRLRTLYGRKHAFLFNGARVAFYALLRAYARVGDVVLPAYTCIAVPEAASYAGYRVRFADAGQDSVNVTAETLQCAFSANSTVCLLTHQFGLACDLDELLPICRARNVLVVEDAAAAMGATYRGQWAGAFGDATLVSFHRTKVIAAGIGGALLLDDDELAAKVERLCVSAHPGDGSWLAFSRTALHWAATRPSLYPATHWVYSRIRGDAVIKPVVSRTRAPRGFLRHSSVLSAALARAQLDQLPANLARRRAVANRYAAALAGNPALILPTVSAASDPAWTSYPLIVEDKRGFSWHMRREGIDVSPGFPYSCAESFGATDCPNARRLARHLVGLPVYPSLSDDEVSRVVAAAAIYASENRVLKRSANPAAALARGLDL
jgi:dTDP-4-amino-4,6-dideoxygalactose transaminase